MSLAHWGKADPKAPGPHGHHSLLAHAMDVAACVVAVLEARPALRSRFAALLGMTDATVPPTLGYFAALHDLGKIHVLFQAKAPALLARVYEGASAAELRAAERKAIGFDHGAAGSVLVRHEEHLRDAFSDSARDLIVAATAHHGAFAADEERHLGSTADLGRADAVDHQARLDFIAAMRGVFAPLGAVLNPPREPSAVASVLFAGLVSFCDWVGSDTDHFSYEGDVRDAGAYWVLSRARSIAAITQAGLVPAAARRLTFETLFGFAPRDVQLLTGRIDTSAPRLIVVEATMGSGKTEAALHLASGFLASGVADGLYAALPTMATANGLFGRVLRFAMVAFSGDVHLRLAHGQARRHEGFTALRSPPTGGRKTAGKTPGDETASVLCGRWLLSRKRALLAQVGVGTVDQAMLAALVARHHFVGLAGLAGHVFVLDEVHAYDAYMLVILEQLIRWLGALGAPVVLLSATLPAVTRRALAQAYREGRGLPGGDPIGETAAYPLVTVTDDEGVRTLALEEVGDSREVQVEIVRTADPVGELLPRLVHAVRAGARVVWIRNTVRAAQEAYSVARAELPEAVLFHARYVPTDRRAIEDAVLGGFGRAGTRASGLLIATQVVEQSLDLDFDLMVTDLCPIDLALQRVGRLHRHAERPRPEGFGAPRLLVVAPPPEDVSQLRFGPRPPSYDSASLWLTLERLERPVLCVPLEIRDLVEDLHDPDRRRARVETSTMRSKLEPVEAKRHAEIADIRRRAAMITIRSPNEPRVAESPATDEELLEIATRLGESQRLLLVAWDVEECVATTLAGDPLPVDSSAPDAFRRASSLEDDVVGVPGRRFSGAKSVRGEQAPWEAQKKSLENFLMGVGLRDVLVVWTELRAGARRGALLGRNGGETTFSYDSERGLVLS